MKIWKTIRKELILFRNRVVHGYLNFDREKKKFVFPDTWKKPIKYATWILNVISWLTAFLTMEQLPAFLVAIGFSGLTWIIGRNLFYYRTFVDLSNESDFEINHDRWFGTTFGRTDDRIPLIGFVCADDEYANQLYSMLTGWASGKSRDIADYMTLSVVVLPSGGYVMYCYPNIDNPVLAEFYEKIEQKKKESDPFDRHAKYFFMPRIGKTVPDPNPDTRMFLQHYEEDIPVMVTFFVPVGQGIRSANVPDMITLGTIKMRRLSELTRQDPEFGFIELNGTYEKESLEQLRSGGDQKGYVKVENGET